jgi:hypothetical protein
VPTSLSQKNGKQPTLFEIEPSFCAGDKKEAYIPTITDLRKSSKRRDSYGGSKKNNRKG